MRRLVVGIALALGLLSAGVVSGEPEHLPTMRSTPRDLHVDARFTVGLGGTYVVPAETYRIVNVTNIDGCRVVVSSGIVAQRMAFFSAPRNNGSLVITGGLYAALWIQELNNDSVTKQSDGAIVDSKNSTNSLPRADASSLIVSDAVVAMDVNAAGAATCNSTITALGFPTTVASVTVSNVTVRVRGEPAPGVEAVRAVDIIGARTPTAMSASFTNVTITVHVSAPSVAFTASGIHAIGCPATVTIALESSTINVVISDRIATQHPVFASHPDLPVAAAIVMSDSNSSLVVDKSLLSADCPQCTGYGLQSTTALWSPVAFFRSTMTVQCRFGHVIHLEDLASALTITGSNLNLGINDPPFAAVVLVERMSTALGRIRFNGGTLRFHSMNAPEVVVVYVRGSASSDCGVSVVFARAFAERPPVTSILNDGIRRKLDLVGRPRSVSVRVWADVRGPPTLRIVGFVSPCMTVPGTALDCSVTLVQPRGYVAPIPLPREIFRELGGVAGFHIYRWATPVYTATLKSLPGRYSSHLSKTSRSGSTSFPGVGEISANRAFAWMIAKYFGVAPVNVGVWKTGPNVTFSITGPESVPAYANITGDPTAFEAAVGVVHLYAPRQQLPQRRDTGSAGRFGAASDFPPRRPSFLVAAALGAVAVLGSVVLLIAVAAVEQRKRCHVSTNTDDGDDDDEVVSGYIPLNDSRAAIQAE